MMKNILILSALAVSFNSFSTEVLLLGGGGDPEGSTTIFDDALRNLVPKKSQLNFNMQVSFNGGHSTTESIIANELKTPSIPFTGANYAALVKKYISKIESGEIKSGENLLVLLDTHGGEKSSEYKTHSIATSGSVVEDKTIVAGGDTSSLDLFIPLAELAKKKGIKLGIVDLSCHAGNSQILANQNTCVISASGPNHFSYSTFAERFFDNLEKGKSLEEVFLNTRASVDYPSFPMISTAIGNQLRNEQYNLLSPYLNVVDSTGTADKLTPYLRSVFVENNYCKREDDFKKLIAQIEELQKIAGIVRNQEGETLVDALKNYKKLQDDYIKTLVDYNYPLYSKKVDIIYGKGKKGAPIKEEIMVRDVLRAFPVDSIDYFKERMRQTKDPAEKKDLQNAIAKFERIDEVRKEILKTNPTLSSSDDFLKNLKTKSLEIWSKASQISSLSSKLYDKKYRALLKTEGRADDPCRNFVL